MSRPSGVPNGPDPSLNSVYHRNISITTHWTLPLATWSFHSSMMSLGIKSTCACCSGEGIGGP